MAQIGPALTGELFVEFFPWRIRENLVQFARELCRVADELIRPHRDRVCIHHPRERHAIAVHNVSAEGDAAHGTSLIVAPAGEHAHPGKTQHQHRRDGDQQQQQDHQALMRYRREVYPVTPDRWSFMPDDDGRHQRADLPIAPIERLSSNCASSIAMRSALREVVAGRAGLSACAS